MHWWDLAQPLVAGLGGILGVYAADDLLKALRCRGYVFPGRRR
jgi:hypothetical protein